MYTPMQKGVETHTVCQEADKHKLCLVVDKTPLLPDSQLAE